MIGYLVACTTPLRRLINHRVYSHLKLHIRERRNRCTKLARQSLYRISYPGKLMCPINLQQSLLPHHGSVMKFIVWPSRHRKSNSLDDRGHMLPHSHSSFQVMWIVIGKLLMAGDNFRWNRRHSRHLLFLCTSLIQLLILLMALYPPCHDQCIRQCMFTLLDLRVVQRCCQLSLYSHLLNHYCTLSTFHSMRCKLFHL